MDKDGGAAFPAIHSIDGNWVTEPLARFRGMTLRDYFAAAALQGYLASWPEQGSNIVTHAAKLATSVYAVADAMLAERAK